MKKWLTIEAFTLRNEISSRLQYRLDLVISTIGIGISQIGIPIYTLLLYGVSQGFPGWSLAEALLLSSYISLAEGITGLFFQGIIWNTLRNVQKGTMDIWLLAPTNPLAYFINRSVDIEDIGRVTFSLAITIYASILLQAAWWVYVVLAIYIIIPILFFSTIGILASAFSIRYVDSWRIYDVVHSTSNLAKYPTSIYPNVVRWIFLSIIPLGAIGFVPISVFVQAAGAASLLTALAVITVFSISVWWWHETLKNYASAGG